MAPPPLPAQSAITIPMAPSGALSVRWNVKQALKDYAEGLYWRARNSGVRWHFNPRRAMPSMQIYRLGRHHVVNGWINVSSALLLVAAAAAKGAAGANGSVPANRSGESARHAHAIARNPSISSKRASARHRSMDSDQRQRSASMQAGQDPLAQAPRPTGIRMLGSSPASVATDISAMEMSHWKTSARLKGCWQEDVALDSGVALTPEMHAREVLTGLYWGSIAMSHDLRSATLDLWLKTAGAREQGGWIDEDSMASDGQRQRQVNQLQLQNHGAGGGTMSSAVWKNNNRGSSRAAKQPGNAWQPMVMAGPAAGEFLYPEHGRGRGGGHGNEDDRDLQSLGIVRKGKGRGKGVASAKRLQELRQMRPSLEHPLPHSQEQQQGHRESSREDRQGEGGSSSQTQQQEPAVMAQAQLGSNDRGTGSRGMVSVRTPSGRPEAVAPDAANKWEGGGLIRQVQTLPRLPKPKTKRCGRPMVFMPQLARSVKVMQYEGCDVATEQSLLAYRITRPKALWMSKMYLAKQEHDRSLQMETEQDGIGHQAGVQG